MKQALHILKKDLRQHWIALSCALASFIGMGRLSQKEWQDTESHLYNRWAQPGLLLVWIVAWWILAARLVQSESLAGDRQFWLTRPYRWRALLTVKIVSLFATFCCAFVCLQCYLAWAAGFGLTGHFLAFLWRALEFFAFAVLPVIAIACVTESLARFFTGILFVVLFTAGVTALYSLRTYGDWSPNDPSDLVMPIALLTGCAAVIVLQYARRKTKAAVTILAGAAVLIASVTTLVPNEPLVRRAYAEVVPSSQAPGDISIPSVAGSTAKEEFEPLENAKSVRLHIPLSAKNGIEPFARIDGYYLTIESPGIRPWRSGWHGDSILLIYLERPDFTFEMPVKDFQRLSARPVTLTIEFAITSIGTTAPQRIAITDQEFAVAGLGRCHLRSRGLENEITCRALLADSRQGIAKARGFAGSCADSRAPGNDRGINLENNFFVSEGEPWNPVSTSNIFLTSGGSDPPRPELCPGTQLEISYLEPGRRMRIKLILSSVRLADYREAKGSLILGITVTK